MTDPTLAIVLYSWACATLAGITMLLMAWRGRQVNSAPLCRTCGFSLHRLPLQLCPECGSRLRGRAILYGERQGRPLMLRVAIGLLILSTATAGLGGWQRVKTVDWMKVKPAWMLSQDARGTVPAIATPALEELTHRARRGAISGWVCQGLVAHALEQQRDILSPWEPLWGDFVESARTGGLVSDKDWGDYLREAIPFELIPSGTSNDNSVDMRIKVGPIRIGSNQQATIKFQRVEPCGCCRPGNRASRSGSRSRTAAFSGTKSEACLTPSQTWTRPTRLSPRLRRRQRKAGSSK